MLYASLANVISCDDSDSGRIWSDVEKATAARYFRKIVNNGYTRKSNRTLG